MIRVPVEKLAEGQVLAQDVTRADGVVLMGKGKAITPEVISLLLRLEIAAVVVEGDLFASDQERDAFLAQQEAALARRFSRVQDDPLQRAICELFRRRIAGGCHPRLRAGRDGGD
jgi:hypothetical protein